MSTPGRIAVGVVGAGLLAAAVLAFVTWPRPVVTQALASGDATQGLVVFNAGGCPACHQTPGQDDRTRLGGGLKLTSPFGAFYVPNISSDPEDGIGRWSAADLANAMLAGVSPAGQHYYPAFPYTSYAHMSVADVADLSAYLHTLPPIKGRVRDHDLPFPFTIRLLLGPWKLLYLDRTPIVDEPGRSAEWNRGHYIVDGLGHCAECHSPRGLLGGIVAGERLAGGLNPEGEGWIPNITQAKDGLAAWSQSEIAEVLSTGFTPEFDSVGGSMAAVVRNTSRLPDADRAAMAAYLKALPAREGPKRPIGRP